jgi:TolB protein
VRAFTCLVAVSVAAVVVSAAAATVPGKNGTIVFKRYFQPDTWGAIFTIDASGRHQKQITHPASGVADDQPDWSPDGSSIIFTRCPPGGPCGIYTIRPNGSGLKRANPPCPTGPPRCEDGSNASFLPDGKHFVYTSSTGGARQFPNWEQIQHSDIVVRELDGSNPRVLIRSKPYGADYNSPLFSPNGSRFLYAQANSPLTRPALKHAVFVVSADGRRSKRVTPWSLDAGDNPDWSPNGKLVVFRSYTSDVPSGQSQIYVVRPDGTGLRRLTHFSQGTQVLSYSFSPDGKWITFAKGAASGLPDVFVMRVNGTKMRRVTHSSLWDSAPDWGPAP